MGRCDRILRVGKQFGDRLTRVLDIGRKLPCEGSAPEMETVKTTTEKGK